MLDRAGAKAAATGKELQDPELEARIAVSIELQGKLAEYTHIQTTKNQDLGWVGAVLGGEKNAPIAIAAVALIVSILFFFGIHAAIAFGELDAERIKIAVGAADKCLALATLALGYVCGKSS